MSLQTREASTLVITTVTSSASLLLLPIVYQCSCSTAYQPIAWIGMLFSGLGLAYRQFTVWSIDRKQHNRDALGKLESWLARQRRDEYYLYGEVREFILLWFLIIPFMLWLWVLRDNGIFKETIFYPILDAAILGIGLSGIDAILRWCDKRMTEREYSEY